MTFELVHTMTDWYDGPRRGIADCGGVPCLYQSEWNEGEDMEAETFLLMPIDLDTLELALEDWAIWLRWLTAFHRREATRETHPALPADRDRHETLQRLLAVRLTMNPAWGVRKRATFQTRAGPGNENGLGWRSLEVLWEDVR